MQHKIYTSNILMIRPVRFTYNAQTAENNYFQNKASDTEEETQSKALAEFDELVAELRKQKVQVTVVEDTPIPHTPDSIFPNNWVSFHADGSVALYPMFAKNRRTERREDVLEKLEEGGFVISQTIDYTSAEEEDIFLEGTGSMILDRENRLAYAARSVRTDEVLFEEFCEDFEYLPIVFGAFQTIAGERKPIYHTNVMMCVAHAYAIICLDSIDDSAERKSVVQHLKDSNKEIIAITEEQMHAFAGNMLQVSNQDNELFLVMSAAAKASLSKEQLQKITQHNPIIATPIPTIEQLGGGSVRCMIAEVFLPKN